MGGIREWTELVSQGINVLAVVLMVAFIAVATARWLFLSGRSIAEGYADYRVLLGKSLLVGLELLVAADIIRTVAVDITLPKMAELGALVTVRTFLGWALTVEIEGRWPWQAPRSSVRDRGL
jgi:uncharacterized membrane protein